MTRFGLAASSGSAGGSLLVAACMAGCAAEPSFDLRWDLIDRDGQRQPIDSAVQCASAGINMVRVAAYDRDGLAAERTYPCFPSAFSEPNAAVNGLALAQGEYAIEVRGLQRSGDPWHDVTRPTETNTEPLTACSPTAQSIGCGPSDLVCDCRSVTVDDGELQHLDAFALQVPRECEDGIDNDRDGLVDRRDPACQTADSDAREGIEVAVVQIRLDLSLFDNNPYVTCSAVGLASVKASFCPIDETADHESEAVPCDPLKATTVGLGSLPCDTTRSGFLSVLLTPGLYQLNWVGLGPAGQELTMPASSSLEVLPGPGTYLPVSVDFSASMFAPPVRRSARFSIEFEREPGEEAARHCAPNFEAGEGRLVVETVEFELRDSHGGPMTPPVVWSQACPTSWVSTPELEWGGYTLGVRGYDPNGIQCFATQDEPLVLGPGPDPIRLVVPRLRPSIDGDSACADCVIDHDCGGDHQCIAGVCTAE